MANQEHLDLLKRDLAAWYHWRAENPTVVPNLREADLTEAHLRGAHLQGAHLRKAHLIGADLRGADLRGADLGGADLSGADLSGAHLQRATLYGADLQAATLYEADLSGADLSGADLVGAHLQEAVLVGAHLLAANLVGAHLVGAHLSRADLDGADLTGADLTRAVLQQAHLDGAVLTRAVLQRADLRGADFQRADLQEANLVEADLTRADLTRADLTRADLTRADLTRADLTRADLTGASLHAAILGFTTFGGNDLSAVKGLETIDHFGPSTISIDTLYKSGGKLPAAFLRGCGVPDSFIDYIPLLIGAIQPVQYFSCFISYSTKDDDFARRLHERMRAEHLRVWFAPEEMQGGKKLYDQIDRAIQLHDRLLLVLSEHSMQSNWVRTEIRKARQAELNERRRKLFPITLVIFEALRAWECFSADTGEDLAEKIREYFIPDFSTWKDHDAFESAFARLLRDLRAAERTPPARGQQ